MIVTRKRHFIVGLSVLAILVFGISRFGLAKSF